MAALLRHRLLVVILAVAGVATAAVGLSRVGSTVVTSSAPSIAGGLQRVPLSTPLPSDPDVLTGKFDNGFRFYIRRNTAPIGRAELRLVVNAGSVLEKDDQRGLAHFVEHMAFNGTTHFPKQAIAAFLQSVGMRFGPSVNATTGFDETVYSLQIPTDRPDVVARSMQIFEDWAHEVTFDPAEVERERGVVIEEWRQRRGAGQRLQETQLGLLFTGSPYADRAAIGTLEGLQAVTAERLRAFYVDWYRPDLMAVVAVGDFQPPEIERLVRKHFAAVKSKAGASRPVIDVPPPAAPVFEVIADKEATAATLAVHTRFVPPSQATVGDYRREIAERLAVGMFSARLAESSQRAGSPLLAARASRGRAVRTQDVVTFSTVLHGDAIDKGAGLLFLELARIERFGFTAEELERLKTTTLRGIERAVAEKNHRPSATLAAEYIRHFTRAEPFPGLLYEFDLTKRFLPEITLDEVNVIATAWLSAAPTVLLSAPDRPGVRIPPREWLARVMAAADATTTLTPYVAPKSNQPLLDSLPTGGTIVTTTTRDAIGITEWTLSNGARVVLKPTTFKDDEVVFTALSPGGTSLAPDEDYVPAQTAAQVVTSLGVGRFASADLRRALTGKVAGVRPLITPYEEGLAGGGSARDLEALFQLVYLYFTQPRHDPVLFRALTTQMRTGLATQTATPDFAFASTLGAAVTQNHPRSRPLTPDSVAAMNLDKSIAFYRDRFADASDFTFVFVGSFDIAAMRPLAEQYLASLPTLGRTERWRDFGIRPPSTVVEQRVERGTDPKSRTAMVFAGDYVVEPSQGMALRAAAEVLQTRLVRILREELSGTYTVNAAATVTRIPRPEYRVTVTFGSDPARTDALASRVIEEIARLTAGGPTPSEVANVRTAMLRELETSSRQNAFLMMQIADRYRLGEAPEGVLELRTLVGALDAGAIQAAARAALDPSRYVRVSLGPEKSAK